MKICVQGLWHLGSVTASCLARAGFDTIGLDPSAGVVAALNDGKAPLFEPGLDALIRDGLASGRLRFTTDRMAAAEADVIWVTFDTPVDDDDKADDALVIREIESLFPILRNGAVVLISSQLPVGTTRRLAATFAAQAAAGHTDSRRVSFAYSPENLRLGKAIEVFEHPERIVIGTGDAQTRALLEQVLRVFCERLIWVSVESAELAKHSLNAFLAVSVTFANEIACLCERVGADPSEVEQALRSEPRIGPRAYIRPGAGFAGGTLARDIVTLNRVAAAHDLALPMLGSVMHSNRQHLQWPARQLAARLGTLAGKRIAILGLTYKPDTNSLRRSPGIELCHTLLAQGAQISAHDPQAETLPPELAGIQRRTTAPDALAGADAAVLMTEWPEYRTLEAPAVAAAMAGDLVLDQGRFLSARLADQPGLRYVALGTP